MLILTDATESCTCISSGRCAAECQLKLIGVGDGQLTRIEISHRTTTVMKMVNGDSETPLYTNDLSNDFVFNARSKFIAHISIQKSGYNGVECKH